MCGIKQVNLECVELTVRFPPPPQASAAAEPHAGLLPAGQPAQHGVRVHGHLRDLRAGAGRGRLPLHGLRLAGDLRVLVLLPAPPSPPTAHFLCSPAPSSYRSVTVTLGRPPFLLLF